MIKKGQVYYCDLGAVIGSEQGGRRPVLVLQNDTGNKYSPTTIVCALTSQMGKAKMPMHASVKAGLPTPSVALLEQVRTIDKNRLEEFVCTLCDEDMERVNKALKVSFGI